VSAVLACGVDVAEFRGEIAVRLFVPATTTGWFGPTKYEAVAPGAFAWWTWRLPHVEANRLWEALYRSGDYVDALFVRGDVTVSAWGNANKDVLVIKDAGITFIVQDALAAMLRRALEALFPVQVIP